MAYYLEWMDEKFYWNLKINLNIKAYHTSTEVFSKYNNVI